LAAFAARDTVLILNRAKIVTRKQIKRQAARRAKLAEWSDEDKCFDGCCPGLMLGGVDGSDKSPAA
jgi:hypothetical protein